MSVWPLFASEDILAASCDDSEILQAKAEFFRQSGVWEEVVQGMTDLTVKYDLLVLSGAEAEQQFRRLWDTAVEADSAIAVPLLLTADFADADAPDRQRVADSLALEARMLPEWLSQRTYRVTMMGFQPGFAYLEDSEATNLPTLARLDTPRQHVAAGSIGFLGGRACIYALDGPGGWPIVGRVREPLFRLDNPQPFLLKPRQMLRFRPP